MKVVILSAVLFLLVVAAVIANTAYSNITLSRLEELADSAYKNSTSPEVLSELINYWNSHRDYFSLTASLEDIDKISEHILMFQTALSSQNTVMAEQSYLLLRNSIQSAARFEKISFSNIF